MRLRKSTDSLRGAVCAKTVPDARRAASIDRIMRFMCFLRVFMSFVKNGFTYTV